MPPKKRARRENDPMTTPKNGARIIAAYRDDDGTSRFYMATVVGQPNPNATVHVYKYTIIWDGHLHQTLPINLVPSMHMRDMPMPGSITEDHDDAAPRWWWKTPPAAAKDIVPKSRSTTAAAPKRKRAPKTPPSTATKEFRSPAAAAPTRKRKLNTSPPPTVAKEIVPKSRSPAAVAAPAAPAAPQWDLEVARQPRAHWETHDEDGLMFIDMNMDIGYHLPVGWVPPSVGYQMPVGECDDDDTDDDDAADVDAIDDDDIRGQPEMLLAAPRTEKRTGEVYVGYPFKMMRDSASDGMAETIPYRQCKVLGNDGDAIGRPWRAVTFKDGVWDKSAPAEQNLSADEIGQHERNVEVALRAAGKSLREQRSYTEDAWQRFVMTQLMAKNLEK